jgi:hypothetical protein
MGFWDKYKWYVIGGVGMLTLGIGIAVLIDKLKRKGKDPEVEDADLSKTFNIHLIPDGKNNYRSAQITLDKYPYFVKNLSNTFIIMLLLLVFLQ